MKRKLAYIFPMAVLISFAAGYFSTFQKLLFRWNSGDDNYCYLVVPIFIYLLWEKKEAFGFLEFNYSLWGIFAAFMSMVLTLMGEAASSETIVYIGLYSGLVSIFLTMYGSKTRHLFFPLIILFFIIPLPAFLSNMLTFKLKMASSCFSVDLLRLAGVSVVQEGNIIDLGIDRLQMADACSGLRFFLPLILVGLLAGHFFTRGIWRRAVVLLLVAPLSILINVMRIFASGMLSIRGYREPVTNIFHDLSGWVVFMFAGVVLSLVAYLLGKVGASHYKPYKKAVLDHGAKSVSLRVGIDFTVALCVIFLISGIALSQPDSLIRSPKRQNFETFPMKIGQWEGTRAYISEEMLRSLWADDYVCASFKKKGSTDVIHLFIPYYNYQQTQHTAHAPQSCLLGGGWMLISSYLYPIKVQDSQIDVMVMSLEKGEQIMLGSYFFLGRSRVVTSPFKNKFYLLLDSLTKKRSDGALVRVELIPSDNETLTNAHGELAAFISQLWPVLHAYVPD